MSTLMLRLTLLIALLMAALPVGLSAPRAAHAVTPPPPGSWPFYRYDMQRTNCVPSSVAKGNITQPAIKWSFPVGGAASATAADITGPNGTPDGVPEIIAWGGGRVRAYDSQTGNLLWISELILGLNHLLFVGDVDGNNSAELIVQARGATPPNNWRVLALNGTNGQILSQITGYAFENFRPFRALDADGDGKIEVIEMGYGDPNYQMFTYQAGANNPQLLAQNLPFRSRGRVISADLNGDGSREVLFPEDLPANDASNNLFKLASPPNWSVFTSYLPIWVTSTVTLFPFVIVSDVVPSIARQEVFVVLQEAPGGNVAQIALLSFGAAPNYPLTTLWAKTRTDAAGTFGPIFRVLNLDGGDLELAWSYYSTIDNEWHTEIFESSGNLRGTIDNHRLCGVAQGNFRSDSAFHELALCGIQNDQIVSVAVYSDDLSLVWSQPVSDVVGLGDFNNDGLDDLVIVDGSAPNQNLKVLSGPTGSLLHAHVPGKSFSVRYVGNLDSNPVTVEVLYGGDDGYLHYLDRTLSLQRRVYAAASVARPYIGGYQH